MVGLYKDPKGEDIFSKVTGSEMNNNVHKSMKVAVDESTNDSRNNDSLRKRIVDLEAELKAAKVFHLKQQQKNNNNNNNNFVLNV